LLTDLFIFSRAGDSLTPMDGISFLSCPPISILLDQEIIETSTTTSDGVSKRTAYLEQSLFAIGCGVGDDGLTLYSFEVNLELRSPTTGKFDFARSRMYDEIYLSCVSVQRRYASVALF
jgi:hypothetical protein